MTARRLQEAARPDLQSFESERTTSRRSSEFRRELSFFAGLAPSASGSPFPATPVRFTAPERQESGSRESQLFSIRPLISSICLSALFFSGSRSRIEFAGERGLASVVFA